MGVIADQTQHRAAAEAELAEFQIASAQRLSFDTQLWQIPVLALTGEAFLFSVLLGDGAHKPAKMLAALLAVAVAAGSIILLARTRLSEIAMARELDDRRKAIPDYEPLVPRFSQRRAALSRSSHEVDMLTRYLGRPNAFFTWIAILDIFWLVAVLGAYLTDRSVACLVIETIFGLLGALLLGSVPLAYLQDSQMHKSRSSNPGTTPTRAPSHY